MAWKEGTGIFLPKTRKLFLCKVFPYDHFKFLPTEMAEKLILYHINEDKNVQSKLSASQYGFRAGASLETALHEFVRRVEHFL